MNTEKMLPLEGIKVVELATLVAAPTAGRMLSAYGAEVIKVENTSGDDLRHSGEHQRVICEDYKNPVFTIHNSGKKLVAINLKSSDGKEAFLKLLEDADVLISNVREASLKRLGLDYDSLKDKYPKLIYAHFTGFGPKGPCAGEPGFDSTAFWLRTGPQSDWQLPGYYPFLPTYAFGDMSTSSVLLSGILMALIGRQHTGKGTLVNTSLFASGIWCNAVGVVSHQPQFGGKRRPDPTHPVDPLSRIYKCADDNWIGVFDNEYSRDKEKFARILGIPQLVEDPRCATIQELARTDAVVEIVEKMCQVFLTKTSYEWRDYLKKNDVSCEVLRRLGDVYQDEQAIANGYVEEMEFADGVKAVMPCPPVHFSEFGRRPYISCGTIGEDTDEVLGALGYSEEKISQMRQDGAVK